MCASQARSVSELEHRGNDVTGVRCPGRRSAAQSRVDRRSETALFFFVHGLGAVVELGHDLGREQFERLAYVLVLVASCLTHEYELVDSGVLIRPHQFADLRRRADGAAEGTHALFEQLRTEWVAGTRLRSCG